MMETRRRKSLLLGEEQRVSSLTKLGNLFLSTLASAVSLPRLHTRDTPRLTPEMLRAVALLASIALCAGTSR